MITKESGKMLGTLVALAVAKMANLETFVWDMPTGVLSDIFMSLASLTDHHQDAKSKLDRLWIRWHDNTESAGSRSSTATPITQTPQQAVVPLGSTLTSTGILLPQNASHPRPRPAIPYSESHVEYPTFSVVPPVRSLTVLDIDELAYLDEMSVLIGRSMERLGELRVGISAKAQHKDFVQMWDGSDLHQVDHQARWPGESTIGDRRLGGVLGVLVGRVYDIRRRFGKAKDKATADATAQTEPTTVPPGNESISQHTEPANMGTENHTEVEESEEQSPPQQESQTQTLEDEQTSPVVADGVVPPNVEQPPQPETTGAAEETSTPHVAAVEPPATVDASSSQTPATTSSAPPPPATTQSPPRVYVEVTGLRASRSTSQAAQDKEETPRRKRLDGKLKLHTLELERIPLSMQVCMKAIDWTTITNLTILECPQHENLWKHLRKHWAPTQIPGGFSISSSRASASSTQYQLKLKRIHTDAASAPLINMIKETLAPNTLEVLFLQDRRRGNPPPISLSAIFKGAIKRHRSSLRKLLLDSSLKTKADGTSVSDSTRWKHWILSLEVLLYITSGRMAQLRELAVSLRYSDWVGRLLSSMAASSANL
jgi:hypothetical protein